ncbi:GNAT family N-acetyltransferase [Amycolatopsis rubida]|uniref:Acetyltransferase (GNAT) family protein n=1 Tax=Amycolatopsis rubida TaxID=112413 RepID=A0A1I5IYG1_9PSEU|nr:GNAT family N-acetyltransferase [Amycolatopsis rubida]SFO65605.1 Acetyltransferase (GNAT) family protein [Amycolatopsis rubida]
MEFTIRPGVAGDADVVLGFFDDAVAWLVARGSAGQWGTEPWSKIPKRAERVREYAADPEFRMAEIDGKPAGALILGQAMPYVPPVDEPELYVRLLITSRQFTGQRVGSRLLRHSMDEAKRRGIDLVRVDCWAGGDGDLPRYYQSQGFTPAEQFTVDGWLGQVLEQRVGG